MTDAAAWARRARPQTGLWRSPLARRILAAHLATAGLAFAAALLAGGAEAPAVRVALAALAGVAALWIAAQLARGIADPIARLLRLIDDDAAGDELHRLAHGLRRLLATLADRTATAEAFAADVAHEIRGPLASLRAAAEALERADPATRSRLAALIAGDVARLDRLVGEIAAASRLDAALVREHQAGFDLLATIRAVAAEAAPAALARGIAIAADLPEGALPVTGLEARLGQVVTNLLRNAISLCDEGDAVRLWARRQDNRVLFVVEDTGPGIPDGEAERIFRRFYSHRPAGPGEHSGLGLAIARQIVEAHGGAIWAENVRPTASDLLSEPLGARFVVVLPQ